MRKLAMAAGAAALAVATPALADGRGNPTSGDRSYASSHFGGALNRAFRAFWKSEFSSQGRHFGWIKGKHWGWFKPHNPHWPHHPPVSP